MNKTHNEVFGLISEIDSMLDLSFSKLIDFETILKNWKINEKRMVMGTENICIIKNNKHVRFITEIPPLKSFEEHWHDFKEECIVLSGTLKNDITGELWTKGQKATFNKMCKHIPMNPSKTENLFLIVDFYK